MTKSCLYTEQASSGRLQEDKKSKIVKSPSKKWSPRSLMRDVRLQHLTFTGKIFLLGGWSVKGAGARFSKVPVTLRTRNQIFKSKYEK